MSFLKKNKFKSEKSSVANALCGQSLIELLVMISLLSVVIFGSASLIYKQWLRFQCAYWVFEATHAHLIGAQVERIPVVVRIQEFDWGIRGEGRCQGMTERVELPWLEQASWE